MLASHFGKRTRACWREKGLLDIREQVFGRPGRSSDTARRIGLAVRQNLDLDLVANRKQSAVSVPFFPSVMRSV